MADDLSAQHLPASSAAVFAQIAGIVYDGSTVEDVYQAICTAATSLVGGCDHASLMLERGGAHVTVGATDPVAEMVDELERGTGEGPCLDAITSEAVQLEPDLPSGNVWPNLTKEVVARTPVRGALGCRLMIDDQKVGALNMFSDTAGRFDAESADEAVLLTAFASVALSAAVRGDQVQSLRDGLLSNREIGKAIGLLMVLHSISDDAAFDLLRRTSQQMNVKVAVLARRLVQQHLAESAS